MGSAKGAVDLKATLASIPNSPGIIKNKADEKKVRKTQKKKYDAQMNRRLQATQTVTEDTITRYATKEVKGRLEAHERRRLFKQAKDNRKKAAELNALKAQPNALEKLQRIKRAQSNYRNRQLI